MDGGGRVAGHAAERAAPTAATCRLPHRTVPARRPRPLPSRAAAVVVAARRPPTVGGGGKGGQEAGGSRRSVWDKRGSRWLGRWRRSGRYALTAAHPPAERAPCSSATARPGGRDWLASAPNSPQPIPRRRPLVPLSPFGGLHALTTAPPVAAAAANAVVSLLCLHPPSLDIQSPLPPVFSAHVALQDGCPPAWPCVPPPPVCGGGHRHRCLRRCCYDGRVSGHHHGQRNCRGVRLASGSWW